MFNSLSVAVVSFEREFNQLEPPLCAVAHRYDPLNARDLYLFPDDFLTRAEPESPTGLVLDFDEAKAPWQNGLPDMLENQAALLVRVGVFKLDGIIVIQCAHKDHLGERFPCL